MKAAILTETNNGLMLNNYRGFGAQSVKQIFYETGNECTVFDYSTFWERKDLKESLIKYFAAVMMTDKDRIYPNVNKSANLPQF